MLFEGMLMKTDLDRFCVQGEKKVKLNKLPTRVNPLYQDKEDYKSQKEKQLHKFNTLQELFYSFNNMLY